MILRCTSVLLLLLLVYSEARLVYIHVDYLVNLKQIKKEKCINKDVPESTCHGKCYVREQLTLDNTKQEKEAPEIPSELDTERIPMICQEHVQIQSSSRFKTTSKTYFRYALAARLIYLEIDAPPPQC